MQSWHIFWCIAFVALRVGVRAPGMGAAGSLLAHFYQHVSGYSPASACLNSVLWLGKLTHQNAKPSHALRLNECGIQAIYLDTLLRFEALKSVLAARKFLLRCQRYNNFIPMSVHLLLHWLM